MEYLACSCLICMGLAKRFVAGAIVACSMEGHRIEEYAIALGERQLNCQFFKIGLKFEPMDSAINR
ncbi:MAG: hypothetical protein AAGA21_17285 [Pseudomonadota bacterium]